MRKGINFLLVIVLLLGIFAVPSIAAFPEKPIRLIVPFGPGGGSDLSARIVAEHMSKHLPQPVVVSNIEGGQGKTGEIEVLRSRPDGYTLVWQHQTMLQATVTGRSDYDYTVFETICAVVEADNCLVVSKDFPAKNLAGVIAYIKENPDKVRWAFAANGTSHFGYLAIADKTKVKPGTLIPMVGDKNRIVAILGNNADVTTVTVSAADPYVKAGDLVVLGLMAEERDENYPDYPTLREQGVDALNTFNYCVFAAKGTPQEVKDVLSEAFKKAIEDPECVEELRAQLFKPNYMDEKTSLQFLKEEQDYYKELVDKFNL